MKSRIVAAATFILIAACSATPEDEMSSASDLPILVLNSEQQIESISNLVHGVLKSDENGCMRLSGADDDLGPVIVWHYDTRVVRSEGGRVQVVDGFSKFRVNVGDEFGISGTYVEEPPTGVIEQVPKECASRGYFVAGAVADDSERTRPDKKIE